MVSEWKLDKIEILMSYNVHEVSLGIVLTDSHEISQGVLLTNATLGWNWGNVGSYWHMTRGESQYL